MDATRPFLPLDEDDVLPPPYSTRTRLVAAIIATVMLGFVALAAGASLFGPAPTPDNTRPLPYVPPVQGAVR